MALGVWLLQIQLDCQKKGESLIENLLTVEGENNAPKSCHSGPVQVFLRIAGIVTMILWPVLLNMTIVNDASCVVSK